MVTGRSVRRTAHSDEVIAAHARVLAGSGALSQYVNLNPALWYTLAYPDRVSRLVLLGAPPLLAGTRVPPSMLAVATPTAAPPPSMPPPSRESVVQSMSVFGEAETIVR